MTAGLKEMWTLIITLTAVRMICVSAAPQNLIALSENANVTTSFDNEVLKQTNSSFQTEKSEPSVGITTFELISDSDLKSTRLKETEALLNTATTITEIKTFEKLDEIDEFEEQAVANNDKLDIDNPLQNNDFEIVTPLEVRNINLLSDQNETKNRMETNSNNQINSSVLQPLTVPNSATSHGNLNSSENSENQELHKSYSDDDIYVREINDAIFNGKDKIVNDSSETLNTHDRKEMLHPNSNDENTEFDTQNNSKEVAIENTKLENSSFKVSSFFDENNKIAGEKEKLNNQNITNNHDLAVTESETDGEVSDSILSVTFAETTEPKLESSVEKYNSLLSTEIANFSSKPTAHDVPVFNTVEKNTDEKYFTQETYLERTTQANFDIETTYTIDSNEEWNEHNQSSSATTSLRTSDYNSTLLNTLAFYINNDTLDSEKNVNEENVPKIYKNSSKDFSYTFNETANVTSEEIVPASVTTDIIEFKAAKLPSHEQLLTTEESFKPQTEDSLSSKPSPSTFEALIYDSSTDTTIFSSIKNTLLNDLQSTTDHAHEQSQERHNKVTGEFTNLKELTTVNIKTHSFMPTTTYSSIVHTHKESQVTETTGGSYSTSAKLNVQEQKENTKYREKYISGNNTDMIAAVQFLHYHDKASSEQCYKLVSAHWNYATNLTEENKKKQLAQTLEYSLFHKKAWKNATSFAWKTFNDTLLRRWFKSLSILGTAALPESKLNEFNRLKAEMKNVYSTAKVCSYTPHQKPEDHSSLHKERCNLSLEPDLQRILTKSRDYDELAYVWKAWRDAAGKPVRQKYLRFVNLSNEAAVLNGFADTGELWKESYESESFLEDLSELWEQLRPLYEHLHAYVRRKLIMKYGSDKIKEDGPIPAHLFGNMWAQSWVSLYDITQPYPGKPTIDVTPTMEAKNLTALEMFKISEEFFTSLGLKPMPDTFWKHSLIEKPKDREIICHASAWDFCNGKDYRIKQCTDITMEDLITVHHEMGHVQYFLQYARQPNVFREGANPGFHEAIGDVLALSVSTPKHLQSIGLLENVADDPEGDLNFLLRTALEKVSFLPSGYLIDLWRWDLFSGEIKPEEMNTKWWELRLKYQGICPPVRRTDDDFDPGAKYHVPGNVPYIRYFVSFVIQFQFHKVLCDVAGHTGPLHKCDIYQSKEAGQILSQVMELGSSEHWSEAMKIMTGGATNKMDARPILEYFEPLLNFLMEQNRNETIGWNSPDATICP